MYCGPSVGTCESQVISGVLAKVLFTVGSEAPQTNPLVIYPVIKCIIGSRYT